MLVIGTMEWKGTRERGYFTCPSCASSQPYRLRSSRPFLTLYFIPVLPIGSVSEFVECSGCKSAFEPDVLQVSRGAGAMEHVGNDDPHRPGFEADLLKALAAIVVEDGHVTEDEIRRARHIFQRITGHRLSRDQLGIACNHVRLSHLSTTSLVATMARRRTGEEKRLLVEAMFALAGVGGQLTEGRLKALAGVPQAMGIEEWEFAEAVANAGRWID